jgi:hypothetical protein
MAEDKAWLALPSLGGARQALRHQRLAQVVAGAGCILPPTGWGLPTFIEIARSDTQERSYCNSVDSGKGTGRCRVYLS